MEDKIENIKKSKEESEDTQDIKSNEDGALNKIIREEGSGSVCPESANEVEINYTLKLSNGYVVDEKEKFAFFLNKSLMPKAIEKSIHTMKKGEVSDIEIKHSTLGDPILDGMSLPRDLDIVYTIKLIDWYYSEDLTEKEEEGSGDGGIIKRIKTKGTSKQQPNIDVNTTIKLKCYFIDNNKEDHLFYENDKYTTVTDIDDDDDSNNDDDIQFPSLARILVTMKEEERSIVIIDSKYGYGYQGNSEYNIPPNCNLKYDITLLNFDKETDYWKLTSSELLENAKIKKEEGNKLFNKQKYMRAIRKYKIISELAKYQQQIVEEKDVKEFEVYVINSHLNIAASYNKLQQYKQAIESCNKVMEINSKNIKGLYRRAKAHTGLTQYEYAIKDLEEAISYEPNNNDLLIELNRVKKLMNLQNDKEKELYKGMFERGQIYDDVASPSDGSKSFVERFVENIFRPGISKEHLSMLNYVFYALFLFLFMTIIGTGIERASIHLYALLVLSIGLFLAIQWFISILLETKDTKTE